MAASIAEGWADYLGLRLHYLDSSAGSDPTLTPLVIVPGALGSAEDFHAEIGALAPRRVIAMSLRGRGQSDAPRSGYGFVDQVRDVEAVIDASGALDFCLMGYSLGVAYALGYAILHPSRPAGLIVADYPARYPRLPDEWKQRSLVAKRDRIKPHVIEAMQHDSAELSLVDDLDAITGPVLLMRGDQPDSMLKPDDVDDYLAHLEQAIAVAFPGSGHHLNEPDPERYLRTLKLFLETLDAHMRDDDE